MITFTGSQLVTWVLAVIWPFLRILGLFTSAPLWGGTSVPVRVRTALAVVLAWFIHPLVPAMPHVNPLGLAGFLIGVQQFVIGLALGFIIQMVFSAFTIAGENIALGMGLGFAQLADPQNGQQSPILGQYYGILVMLLFLGFNGHLALINMLVKSFRTLPIGISGISSASLWHLAQWGATMYGAAALVALPAVAALLMVNISFGIITRAAPQLNIFAVGFPLTIMVGFLVVMFTLPLITSQLQSLLESALSVGRAMLGV